MFIIVIWRNTKTKEKRVVLEGIPLLQELIRPGDYFTKIDLRNAYLTLPLREEDRKFVQIKWGEVFYQFRTLAFGLSSAPWFLLKFWSLS